MNIPPRHFLPIHLGLRIDRHLHPFVPLNVPREPYQACGDAFDADNLPPRFERGKKYPQRLREGQTNRWAIQPLVVRVQTGSVVKNPVEGEHHI